MISANETHSAIALKAREYLAGWQRARADLDNFRKTMQRQTKEQEEIRVRELVEPLISLADNFTSLVRHIPADLQGNTWAEGVIHVARQLTSILEHYHIEIIEPENMAFDPKWHEAVEHVRDTAAPSGQVVEVLQAGYRRGETIIRPARVKVAA